MADISEYIKKQHTSFQTFVKYNCVQRILFDTFKYLMLGTASILTILPILVIFGFI